MRKELNHHYPSLAHGGIDIDTALQQLRFGANEAVIQGESGAWLRVMGKLDAIAPNLAIADALNPYFHMDASIYPLDAPAAVFDIRTRLGTQRHPDMCAKAFVVTSLAFFQSCGVTVASCLSSWPPWSDNYTQYHAAYRALGCEKQAALATWSGKLFASLGFTIVQILRPARKLDNSDTLKVLFFKSI